jgi:predicted NAD-dependent protein-ADP-ribosyltransferase YbiA (DUF1768 family)
MEVDFQKDFQSDLNLLVKNYNLGDHIRNFPGSEFENVKRRLEKDRHCLIAETRFGFPLTAIFFELCHQEEMGPLEIDGRFVKILDNFAEAKFVLDGLDWGSSEQAYQASKFEDVDVLHYASIYLSADAYEAYAKGQSRDHPIRPNFSDCRKDLMYRCNMAKIIQNKEIAELLVSSTGRIQFSVGDGYWKTVLPEIMKAIRNELNLGIVQITPHKTKKTQFVPLKVQVSKNDPFLTKYHGQIIKKDDLGEEIYLSEFLERCLYKHGNRNQLVCRPSRIEDNLKNCTKRFINSYMSQNLIGEFSVDEFFVRVVFEGVSFSYSLSDLQNDS